MLKSNSDLERQSLEQHDLLVESRRRLDVRDRIDERRGLAQGQVRRERLERATRFESESKGEMSGNAALGASALIQAALGVELTLSSLNKLADPQYVANFTAFVRSSPGALSGILSPLVQTLVLPHGAIFARLVEVTELLLGVILLIGAAEIGRRRFTGWVGAQHGYEAPVALVSALAGLAAAGLTLSIGILMGEGFPRSHPDGHSRPPFRLNYSSFRSG